MPIISASREGEDLVIKVNDKSIVTITVALFADEHECLATEVMNAVQDNAILNTEGCAVAISAMLRSIANANGMPIDDILDHARDIVMNPREHLRYHGRLGEGTL